MRRIYELFIATRYLRSKNKSRFVSFISLMSVIGIAIAVAVLIVVLSVMNGFEYEVRHRILDVISHASISGLDGHIEDWPELLDVAAGEPGVTASAPYIAGQGMAVGNARVAGLEIRGVRPEASLTRTTVGALVEAGSLGALQPGRYGLLLGRELAARLGVAVGDRIVVLTNQGVITPAGFMPRMRRFEVVGIFYAGMYEFDRGFAYAHIEDAARLLRFGESVSGVQLAVAEPLEAPRLVREVARGFGGGVYVSDWTRQQANFFRSIELTKSIIFMILLLVVAVAAFNIVSTLVMVVRDKRAEIAILRSMGANASSILWIFVSQGVLIGLIGTTAGFALGVVVSWNLGAIVALIEGMLQIRFLAPDVYFISDLPTRVLWSDVMRICGITLALSLVSTVYPAWRGAATNPAEALRHE